MLTLRCFGEVTAVTPRGVRLPVRTRKHTGLLLYMVAHARTVHTRGELAHLLWERNNTATRHSLSQALYDIRARLGSVVTLDTNAVRLVPQRISYELDAFEEAFQSRDHERVVKMYRGEFASELENLGADEFDRWMESERERCRVLVAMALKNAQRSAEASGDWDAACLAALRLVKLNEFDEDAHCALMRGLCMKGDHASALAHYRGIEHQRWVGDALKLAEVAMWAEDSYHSGAPVVIGSAATVLNGRNAEFGKLSALLQASESVPNRVALVGERGMGRNAVMRAFARVVESAGGTVQWLISGPRRTSAPAEPPVPPPTAEAPVDPPGPSVAGPPGLPAAGPPGLPTALPPGSSVAEPSGPMDVVQAGPPPASGPPGPSVAGASGPLRLAEAMERNPGELQLILFRADHDDWVEVTARYRRQKHSRAIFVGLCEAECAKQAEAAGLVDTIITFDPLNQETCAAFVHQVERGSNPRQAAASARLAGGNPALARAIAQAWVRAGYNPTSTAAMLEGGRLACERSTEVRMLIDRQLEPLSDGERELAARLALITPAAQAHAGSVVEATFSADEMEGLRARGWIRSSREAVELTRPLAGQTLTWNLTETERAGAHIKAARALEAGGLGERAAAVSELAEAGERERAFDLGCDVAADALRKGRSPIAGHAATLAFEHATAGPSRLRAGFLLAEAELQRGRFRHATGMLHQLAALARTGSETGRVHLSLARAAVASGDHATFDLHARRLAESRENVTDDALERAVALQLAVFQTAQPRSPNLARDAALDEIRRTIPSASVEDLPYAGHWCDAFRLLFNRVGRRGTRTEARLLLEANRHALGRLGYEGRRATEAAEFWVAVRSAHLRYALEITPTSSQPPDESLHESATLNNLGAVLLELGDFDAAHACLRSSQQLDEALESPARDRFYPVLNQATCAFFRGDTLRCRSYTEQMLRRPDQPVSHALNAQAWALNGLVALATHDRREVRVCRERLRDRAEDGGDDDQYLVNWFLAASLGPRRRADAVDNLIGAADRTAALDRLSAEKLRVLAGAYAPLRAAASQRGARGFLRSAGASWFVRFADSWSRAQT